MNVFEKSNERLWDLLRKTARVAERKDVKKEFAALKRAGHAPIVLFLYVFLRELNAKSVPCLVYGHDFPQAIAAALFGKEKTQKENAYNGKKLALYIEIGSDRKEEVDALLKSRYAPIFRPAYYVEKADRYVISSGTYYLANGIIKKPLVEVNGETCIVKEAPTALRNENTRDGFYFALFPRKRVGVAEYEKITGRAPFRVGAFPPDTTRKS